MLGLRSAIQRYDWGSTTHLPELLGVEPDGGPYAELWMGAHQAAPCVVLGGTSPGEPLSDLLSRDPGRVLGADVVARFGPRLPYLFKVLAIARPVSLQVHPDSAQAAAGWAREEAAGLPLTSPERLFRDPEHKPEMVVALTRFEALAGFRHPERILELLDGLTGALAARLRREIERGLADGDPERALREAFAQLLRPAPAQEVTELVGAVGRRAAAGTSSPRADATVALWARWYPGDPGAVAGLFLNRVTLEPGESMFVPAGSPHTYLEGSALEAMACSDNVLRAGLTAKHVDRGALLAYTRYEAGSAQLTPAEPSDATGVHQVYRAPAREFGVIVSNLTGPAVAPLPADQGPRIALCLGGELRLTAAGADAQGGSAEVRMTQGDVVLVTADDGAVSVSGQGRLATVFVPEEAAGASSADAGAGPGAPRNTHRR